jgi:hypothetical protein
VHRLALLAVLVACKSSDKAPDKVPPPSAPAKPAPPSAPPIKGPHVDPTAFDRTCTAATDCVIVKPASCDPCACPTEAIASKEMAKFDEAAGKLACDPPDLSVTCAACVARVATCEAGRCTASDK